MKSPTREAQWEPLYFALVELMSRWGKDQGTAEQADYLVISDDWGTWSQDICIANPNIPMDNVRKEIQRLLSSKFPDWNVIVAFADGTDRETIQIFADRVVHNPKLEMS